MRDKFLDDTQKIYDQLSTRQNELNSYFNLTKEFCQKTNDIVDDFLTYIGCKKDNDSTMAALIRIINMREDALEQVLIKNGFSLDDIIEKKELSYQWVARFHTARHLSLLEWIDQKALLTPFYRALLKGVHNTGTKISNWQSKWTAHIIHNVNKELLEKFQGDDSAVMAYLHEYDLLDKDTLGIVCDRSYSVLDKNEHGQYNILTYSQAFCEDVQNVTISLKELINQLKIHDDEVWNQKDKWISYFVAIENAFLENDVTKLIQRWQEVDKIWMMITTPIQVGHPLEYYEDHYRKAVALEWDTRIINPRLQHNSQTQKNIIEFVQRLSQEIGDMASIVAKQNIEQVNKTQLYIGQPMFYYAAEFNGLFSAQVVPNDKTISDEYGHKIFAYSDFIHATKLSKPIMRLSVEIMGEKFIRKNIDFAKNNPKQWHEVYDISTIGHEFGHILWLVNDTQIVMNKSGQFKNIEEFKATAGGLMAFFHHNQHTLKEHIVDDLISRSIGLMSWREVGEVLPYYCEGLIHLDILFNSGIIDFQDTIIIDYTRYETMKHAYEKAYKNLVQHYLEKLDASIYLGNYAVKENGIYLPTNQNVRNFVEHYYARYKEIGQQTVIL